MRRDLLRQPDPDRAIGFAEWQITEYRGSQLALTLAARRHARGHELTGHFYLLFGASLTEGLDLLGREDAPLSSITSPTVACR